MTPDQALRQEAAWVARSASAYPSQNVEAIALRHSAYIPRKGNRYQCPRCWISRGAWSDVYPVEGDSQYDVLRCASEACRADYLISLE